MDFDYEIEAITKDQIESSGALDLVWRVFKKFEAHEYSAEGVNEFKSFIEPASIKQRMTDKSIFIWGCFDKDKIVGVIASRPPCHISLLFVDEDYHRRCIARRLYNTVLDFYETRSRYGDIHHEMTVNSSPYAVKIYRRLGFTPVDTEQLVNGIRFIPMKHRFR